MRKFRKPGDPLREPGDPIKLTAWESLWDFREVGMMFARDLFGYRTYKLVFALTLIATSLGVHFLGLEGEIWLGVAVLLSVAVAAAVFAIGHSANKPDAR